MITLTNSQHWLIDRAKQTPNIISISSYSEDFTFEQFLDLSFITAQYLVEHKIKKGENVCILSEHSYRFWIVVNALWLIGAVPVLLNSRNKPEETKWQLNKVDSNKLINLSNQIFEYDEINNITLDDCDFKIKNQLNKKLHYTKFLLHNSAIILFTSGSTGKPKAVVHTFNSLFESVRAADQSFNLSGKDNWLASLPLYHIGGFMILVRSLLTGGKLTFPKSVKHNDTIEAIYRFNPTHFSCVITTLKRILDDKVKPNHNLQLVLLGGGPISNDIYEQALQNGFPIVKVYGSSETCSMICALKPEVAKTKLGSSGKVLSDQIKLVEFNGEILVSSPTLFTEYYNDDEITKSKIRDNFYRTGDFGSIDNEGFLFIDSRREDIIISGGENISSNEIETALKQIGNIHDCFVFSLNDVVWGQIVCAAVVSTNFSEEELKSVLTRNLASYKIPKKFFFVKGIPRNEMGKVKRQELIESLNLDAV